MSCEEIFSQESGLVCKKTIEIVELKKEVDLLHQFIESREDLVVKKLNKERKKLEQQLKEARKHLTESITRECKCEVNTSVNNDLVNRNLELKKLLERIVGMCGNPIASDGCRGILKLHKEYLTKYKVKE